MQLTKYKKIKKLAGTINPQINTFKIFDERICEFLFTLSKFLFKNKNISNYKDLFALAFWIRKKNILTLKEKYQNSDIRLGHGLVFHITPANVALNFAYSFIISLLAGNSNVIRVSNKNYFQNKIFFKTLNKVFNIKKFNFLKKSNLFICYEYDNLINNELIANCDCKIFWGSDKTIRELRKIPSQASCKEIIFFDRYSVSLINLNYLSKLNNSALHNLSNKFYLDSYVFDQNACSSPHLIIWFGKKNEESYKKFWNFLKLEISKQKYFIFTEKKMFDKYTRFCQLAASKKEIKKSFIDGSISRMVIKNIPKDFENLRVGNGFFFEYFIKNLNQLDFGKSKKIQTMTYFGFKKEILNKFIYKKNFFSIDRIVPIGRALEFSNLWDGYDLIRSLSKIVDIK